MNKYAEHSRWKEAKGCTRKRRFADAEEAEAARIASAKAKTYHCPYCGGWHLTGSMAASERLVRNVGNNHVKK